MSDTSAQTEQRPGQEPLILLVDDNATNLQVLYGTLNNRGYKLLIAKSGEDALAIARRARPELVLLDIMMPGIDGYETCRRLKEDPGTRESDVIFLSALDQTENKVQGLDLGAVDYITKPFQAAEVVARVSTHLTIHRLRRDLAARNEELAAANERMKRDLDAAARVQQSLLHAEVERKPGVDFAWRYLPCDELAGDSLSLFWLDEATLGFYVLDVSGHGVPSSLLSVSAAHSLTPRLDRASLVLDDMGRAVPPVEVVARLNAAFPSSATGGHFFTVLYGVLDARTGKVRFSSAGQGGPLVIRADGRVEKIEAPGFPIGLMDGCEFDDHEVDLAPGERLVVFSDGIPEAMNARRELFGEERMHQVLLDAGGRTLEAGLDAMLTAVADWRQGGPAEDDISILGVAVE